MELRSLSTYCKTADDNLKKQTDNTSNVEIGLGDLPIEMVEAIARYLSVDDVCACSQVNTIWRNAFNSNLVWKRYKTYHPRYFNKQKSMLNNFPSLKNNDFCDAKKSVLKELFVRRNLSCGNYHAASISCHFYCDSVLDTVDETGNHWLFISSFFEPMPGQLRNLQLQVWKLNDVPTNHSCITATFNPTSTSYTSKIQLYNDKLIVMYEGEAIIYEFAYPLHQPKFLGKISCSTMMKITNAFCDKIICTGGLIFGFVNTISHQVQKVPPSCFVWNSEGIHQGTVHSSYFCSSFKINGNEFSQNQPILNLKSNEVDKIVVHTNYFNWENCKNVSIIQIFDVIDFKYLPQFYVERTYFTEVEICKNIMILFYKKLFYKAKSLLYGECFDVIKGDIVYTIKFNVYSIYKLVPNIQDGEVVVLERNKAIVFDITLKNEIKSFEIPGKVSDLSILKKDLLLLETSNKGVYSHQVWNYKFGRKLYDLDLAPVMGADKHGFIISLMQEYSSPAKVIILKNPEMIYHYANNYNTSIIIFSFW